MKSALKWPVLAMLLCAPLTAEAHRVWMLPSATVLSGDDVWITVDAAVSNDLFYFEHFPLQIANLGSTSAAPQGVRGRAGQLSVTAPDGSTVRVESRVHTQKDTIALELRAGDGFLGRFAPAK